MTDLKKTKSKEQLKILRQSKLFKSGKNISDSKLNLALKKGHCPFDFMTSKEYILRKDLPPRTHFYSKMNLEELSLQNYQHCQDFWATYECDSLLKYLKIYCQKGTYNDIKR